MGHFGDKAHHVVSNQKNQKKWQNSPFLLFWTVKMGYFGITIDPRPCDIGQASKWPISRGKNKWPIFQYPLTQHFFSETNCGSGWTCMKWNHSFGSRSTWLIAGSNSGLVRIFDVSGLRQMDQRGEVLSRKEFQNFCLNLNCKKLI